MPNIRQQEKRVRTAAREREENLRYRSTAKTLMKRLQVAVEGGKAEEVGTEHRSLVQLLDRAASRGALHKNTASRRKAQAARLATSTPAAKPAAPAKAAAKAPAKGRKAPAKKKS